MNSKYEYVVFIDLDFTLLKVNSGKVLVLEAFKKGMMSSRDFIFALYLSFLYKFELKPTEYIIKRMPGWMTGKSEQDMIDFCRRIFEENLVQKIHPFVQSEIERHRKQNAYLVILSAALNYICEPIATHLRIDDMICSFMEVKNGIFTGETKGPLCFGHQKLVRVREYCKSHNFSLDSAYYYGDSIADLDVLSVVKNPVCINPDKRLVHIARKKSWTIHK